MGSSKWMKITSKKFFFEGEFYPLDLYNHIKEYLEEKQYDLSESEVEMHNLDGKIKIVTHLLAELEYSRRYYNKLAFSLTMEGGVIDPNTSKVRGKLEFHLNGFFQQHSLLHEEKETAFTKFLTNLYDNFFSREEKGQAIVNVVMEMGKLMAEVKGHVHRK